MPDKKRKTNDAIPFKLWLEFEHWQPPSDDPTDDFFNMVIELATGERYALNVWTFRFFERACRDVQVEGRYLGGTYLPAPDLFVSRLERAHLEEVARDLITPDGLSAQWRIPPENAGDDPQVETGDQERCR